MIEVNQIAIINLVGLDKDPESGKETVYYQVINPTGISGQKTSGIKSPVYTYRVEAYTSGGAADKTLELLPRRPFFDHYQALIVTERFARDGIREMINFVEKQSNRPSATYLLVAESPLNDIMKTYIPLERLPGRSLRAFIDTQSRYADTISERSRIKDLAENMESETLTILPIVTLNGSAPALTTERYERMDANQGNLKLDGGAIFKYDRMIGKLTQLEMPYYNLLNNQIGMLKQSILVNEQIVDLRAPQMTIRRRLSLDSGRLILNIAVHAQLEIVDNDQNVKLTLSNIADIKAGFNRQLSDKTTSFYEKALRNGWDIAGVEAQIKRKRGKAWANAKKDHGIWRETQLKLAVDCTIEGVGVTLDPYMERAAGGSDGERAN